MDLPNDRQLHYEYDLVIIELIMYSSFSVVCFNVIRTPWAGSVALRAPVGTTKVLLCAWRVCGARCRSWLVYSRKLVPGAARGDLGANDSPRGVVRGVGRGVS